MPRTPNETVPSQFRLSAETLADLDAIARYLGLTRADGRPNRSAAIREAARRLVAKISRKKTKKG